MAFPDLVYRRLLCGSVYFESHSSPQAVVQPFTEVKQGFYPFKLVTLSMNWHPSDDTMIGTELQEGGRTFEYESDFHARDVVDTPENEIVRHIIVKDDVDYHATSELLYSLVEDAKQHFLSYLTEDEAVKVMRDRQKTIELYLQKACDVLKNICKEMLKDGKHSREKE